MKKWMALCLAAVTLLCLLAGCGAPAEDELNLSEEQTAVLQEMGISQEELMALPEEERAALLAEIGYVADHQKEEQQKEEQSQTEKPKAPTAEDVQSGGSYVVTIGDSMLWNYFRLYYVDGKLVKIEVHFQKSSDEPAEEYTVEGEAVKEYSFNFLNFYNATVQEVIDCLTGYGYTYLSIKAAN